ncbi:MAG: Gmad2 immunoglobulin-like domain-containing protein, partial [bacterium]|nr:Gmad2 immunoglobulin-like domain-containing protein [bacterium]
ELAYSEGEEKGVEMVNEIDYYTCMNDRRKKAVKQIVFGVVLLAIAGASYFFTDKAPQVTTFAECANAGNPVMESYPRQCKSKEGKTFREDIGNELEKDSLIRISEPRPNTVITSPLTIKGVARGNWFFEASFPVKLFDGNGELLVTGIAQAKEEWMTTEFVPFEVTLSFTAPATTVGTLVLNKDNPSGLPENEDTLQVPVQFLKAVAVPPAVKACVVSGCSGQICGEEEMMSSCEFKEAYACYKTARCERQTTGTCGWTETAGLKACLDSAR